MSKKQAAVSFDPEKCAGCKTCQIACKDLHGFPAGVNLRQVYEESGGSWQREGKAWRQNVSARYVSVSCKHCEKPACAAVCASGAIKKREDNGLVILDSGLCVNCGACVKACPYGAPQEHEGRVVKCDGCLARVAAGGKPVCVEACPQRALG